VLPLIWGSGVASPSATTRRGPFGGHRCGRRGSLRVYSARGGGTARHALRTVLGEEYFLGRLVCCRKRVTPKRGGELGLLKLLLN
jgi:hypothetical protein